MSTTIPSAPMIGQHRIAAETAQGAPRTAEAPPGPSHLAGTWQSPEPRALPADGRVPRMVLGAARGGADALQALQPATPQAGGPYRKEPPPQDPAARAAILSDARLSNFAYTRDAGALPEGWTTGAAHEGLKTVMSDVAAQMGLHGPAEGDTRAYGAEFGTFVDAKSGLTVSVLHNAEANEVVLSFGGTTSGKATGDDLFARSKPGNNFLSTVKQWGANLLAGLGVVPTSYKQAAQFTQGILAMLPQAGLPEGTQLRTIGHSKGGGEAMFAALSQAQPLTCTAFCPSHLQKGLIDRLPPDNVARAPELVTSISPYGDPVSALRGTVPFIDGLGTGIHFQSPLDGNMLDLHDQFLKHVEAEFAA
jgi:hypothetical protein